MDYIMKRALLNRDADYRQKANARGERILIVITFTVLFLPTLPKVIRNQISILQALLRTIPHHQYIFICRVVGVRMIGVHSILFCFYSFSL